MSTTTIDEALDGWDRLDALVTDHRIRQEKKLLSKLSVAELRVLLVHYRLAADSSHAREFPKSEAVEELAVHRAAYEE